MRAEEGKEYVYFWRSFKARTVNITKLHENRLEFQPQAGEEVVLSADVMTLTEQGEVILQALESRCAGGSLVDSHFVVKISSF